MSGIIGREGGAYPPHLYDQGVFKFGYNDDVDTGTVPEEVWGPGGIITWPNAQAVPSIVSDDAADAAAGAGAQTLFIQGVNDQFDFTFETLALNGLTPVAPANEYLFIDRMFVASHGADPGVSNVGTITATIGGLVVAQIEAGAGQTLGALYTVPNAINPNESARLLSASATVGRQAAAFARVRLITQEQVNGINSGAYRTQADFHLHSQGSSAAESLRWEVLPLSLSAGTRIWMRVIEVSANNVAVSGIFQIGWWRG